MLLTSMVLAGDDTSGKEERLGGEYIGTARVSKVGLTGPCKTQMSEFPKHQPGMCSARCSEYVVPLSLQT